MFWPWERSKTPLVIMVDSELKNSPELQENVLSVVARGHKEFGPAFPQVTVMFNDPIANVYGNGYSRMQYLGFMADKYLDEEYILFVDSDAFFHTYVDREDLWENGKAIIQGRFSAKNNMFFNWKTLDALGKEEFISCMSYFPFIVKREHLPEIREAIRKHRNKPTFEEAYASFAYKDPGAQYDIMCTWLYLNKYDDYTWRIKDHTPNWDGFHRPKPGKGHWRDRSIFRPGDIAYTVPFLSDHCTYGLLPVNGTLEFHYQDYKHTRRVLEHLLLTSLCYLETRPPHIFKVANNESMLSQWVLGKYETFCPSHVQKYPFHEAWYRFEVFDFNPIFTDEEKSVLKAARASRVNHCKHTYIFI